MRHWTCLSAKPPPPQILRDERPIAWPEIPPTELFPIRFAPGVEEFLAHRITSIGTSHFKHRHLMLRVTQVSLNDVEATHEILLKGIFSRRLTPIAHRSRDAIGVKRVG